jgi:hypothetical protein
VSLCLEVEGQEASVGLAAAAMSPGLSAGDRSCKESSLVSATWSIGIDDYIQLAV